MKRLCCLSNACVGFVHSESIQDMLELYKMSVHMSQRLSIMLTCGQGERETGEDWPGHHAQ